MPFIITVKETTAVSPQAEGEHASPNQLVRTEQIYEQRLETLDLAKLIAAVNQKPRTYKPRAPKAAKQ